MKTVLGDGNPRFIQTNPPSILILFYTIRFLTTSYLQQCITAIKNKHFSCNILAMVIFFLIWGKSLGIKVFKNAVSCVCFF